MNSNKIIYSINVADIKKVGQEEFGRDPTDREIKFVENRLCNYIDWYNVISLALTDFNDEKESLPYGNLNSQ